MKKKYRDTAPEEQHKKDIRIARKRSRQSVILSLIAIGIVILRIAVKVYLQFQ